MNEHKRYQVIWESLRLEFPVKDSRHTCEYDSFQQADNLAVGLVGRSRWVVVKDQQTGAITPYRKMPASERKPLPDRTEVTMTGDEVGQLIGLFRGAGLDPDNPNGLLFRLGQAADQLKREIYRMEQHNAACEEN